MIMSRLRRRIKASNSSLERKADRTNNHKIDRMQDCSKKFKKSYKVHIYETGPDGKSSLHTLFNYMQDIASDHAELLGFGRAALMEKNEFWILSRMYAVFYDFPSWGEDVELTTWPSGVDRLFLMRNYQLQYPNGKEIASVSSSWLIIDKTTKRVQRPDHVINYDEVSFADTSMAARPADKLEWKSDSFVSQSPFAVRVSDLDMNMHTNNANYIKWVVDSYDLDFLTKHSPKSLEINYLAESVFDDVISIKSFDDGNRIFCHSVNRVSDDKELCRVKIDWE